MPEFDEFGIPIKSKSNTAVDEFGIPIKKKETTVLQSEQKQAPTSSGTQSKANQKPLATSVSKNKDREGFYTLESKDAKVYAGLPGKEKTQYRVLNNKWQRRDESGWRDLDSQNSIDLLNKYFDKTVKSREDITRSLESNVKKAEVEKELSDKELASVLGWSEQEVKKSKAGSGTPNKDFKAAMVKPDIIKPSGSNAIGTMAVSTQKAYGDLGPNASSEEMKKKTKYYDTVESQKYLKSIGYDIDVNGNESDEKTKIALNKEKVKQDVITKEAFKAADTYESIDNKINQDLLSNDEEFVVTELRKKYSKDGFYFEETGAGNSMIVKYSPIDGVKTTEIEIPLNTDDINNVNALKDFMKQSYMTASEKKNLNSEELDIKTQEGRDAHVDKLLKLMADNPYKYGSSLLSEDEIENHINNSYSNLKENSKNLQQEYKDLQYRIDKFNQDPSNPQEKAFINNKIHELSQKELQINNRYNDLSSVDKSINKIASINYNKSKEPGNWIGVLGSQFIQGITNPEKALTQISMDVLPYALEILPYSAEENIVDPMTRQKLKDQGYTDIQILDYASKELKNNLYENLKEGITNVSSLGTTTSDYVNSKDRNDLLKAASFLAESIGTSLSAGGNPTLQKVAFFTQSYNSMEEQMVGPEFDSLNEWQKKLISVPYGFVIGALERYGIAALGEGANPIVNKFATAIVNRTMLSLPKDATVDTIKREINKSVGAMIAQGALKVAGGSLVEGGTEATQQLFEIGEKFLVNKIVGSDKEPGFEYFKDVPDITTADGLKKAFEIAGTDFYYGALGGLLMSGGVNAYQTTKQNSFNKKTDQEFEAFYDSMTDDKLRKLNVLNTKIKLKNGEITKEEAKETIDAINSSSQKLKSLNPNLSIRDKKDAFNLMLQRDKLEQEKAPLDEAMQAPYNERITNINNELKTISENAVKESTVEEVTAEGGGVQYQGAQEGQPEVGQGEGAVGQATQPEADLGDSTVASKVQQEEVRITRNVINRPATLSEFGGNAFDAPLQGDTYIEGQQVVFEDRSTGRIYELGNVDEVMDSEIPGLQAQEETISITPEGKVSIEGNNWNIQSELPTQGIEYNPAGEVIRVSLKDDAGNAQMFEGQQAVDIAYQVELQKIQSTEQQQFINDLLEQDEEFQTATESIKPRQIEAVVKEEAAPDTVPIEPTVAEEVVAEQFSDEEVDRLGKLLEGTDEQIDEQIGKLKISKDNSKVAQSIANAAKSIAKIFPDVKFVVHDNDKSYRKATNEQGRSQSSSGEYNPKTKTININASKANNRTAAHEVFHAILLNKIGSDIEAQRLTKAMINSVMKSLVQVKGSPKVISYLNDFASNYEKNIQNEEKLAELFGILADNYAKLPADTKNIIQRFIDRVRKILGLKPMTDREVIDFMNTISQKVATGQEITQKDISFLGNGTIDVTTSRKSKFIDSLVFERFPTNKNTKVIEDFKLSDINGQVAASTLSDKLTAGKLKKVKTVKGQETVDAEYIFYGGVGYPEVTGYVWAASTKDGVQKIIDSMVVSSDGYRYLIPAIMSNTSHMSNRNMTLITMEVFKEAIANNELNRTKFKELVSKAFSNKKAEKFKDGALNAISGNISGNQMCDNLKNYMLSSKMSFESRKDVLKSMVGNPESGNPKFSTVGTYLSLATSLSEPIVKDANMHQVAVVIRTKGNLTPKETDTNDVFYHDSYGFHIESDQEIEVLHLDGIYNLVDVIPEFTTDQGRTVSTKEELKEKGQKGWDIKRILTNLGRTHGLSKYSAEIISPRKQLIGENANLAQNVRDNLQVARNMEDAGKSVKDIRIATGWERGADKKWKYEIIDGKLKVPTKSIDDKLNNLLDSDELFDMYPQLKNIDVKLRLNGIGDGSYSPRGIIVNGGKNDMLSILLHEVQHAIQSIEGFARGGNVEMMKTPDDVLQNLANKLPSKALTSAEKSLIKDEYEKNGLRRLPILPTSLDVTSDSIDTIEDFIDKLDVLVKLFPNETSYKNLQDALDLKLMEMGGKDVAFEKYQKIAGETEARNVETRMKMTPEERRQTTLQETEDVSREDQIIFFEGQKESIDSAVRKQKADTISKMVSIAKDNNFSDSAIREYLKRKGFSDKESTNAINEYNIKKEGIFVAKDGGVPTKISDSIKSFKKKFFSARAFLPKSVFGYKENKEADIARNLNIVDLNVKDFNRLHSKYKGTKAEKDKIVENFDAYVRGDKNIKLPKEFLSVADSMRNQIDNLSRQLIDNGLVDADMAQTIKDNMGQYLTRSYKIYKRENWKKEVEEEIKQKARNLLRSQYRSMAEDMSVKEDIPVDEVLDNIVDNKIDEILTTKGASNFITGSKLGAKDLSVLKERQDIPFEIRALMGEYSDPALNYAETVLKLSSLAANHKFLTEVKNAGVGVYLFEKNDPRRPKDFNAMIAAEESKGMNPLNGLYTTKEIASQFETQPNQLSEFMKLFMKFQSSIRWAKTIGSVATHMKNVIGNLGFVWTNGHFEPDALAKAYSTVKNDFSKSNKQDLRDRMNNYISLGIVKQSAGLGEIKDMFEDANWDTAMASRLSNERLGIIGKAKRFFLQKKKVIEDAYQAEDDFFKIIAYENELSRYSEAMFNKNKNNLTEEELKEVNKVVTEIVKNTYPTYDRIPEAIKMIRRAPFIGNFVSFQAEAYRTAWNTMILTKNELASDNPKIKSIGAKRLTGATTYISAKTAALQYFSMAAGSGLTGILGYLFDDDDEEKRDKDIREFVAPWSKESDLIVVEVGNGKLKYIDFSASDPHGGIKKVMNSFLQGESTIDSFIDGAFAAVSPFIGEEMATESLLELKNNQDKYGKQIWNPEEDLSEQSKNILVHLYKLIEPGTFSSIRRGVSAENKGQEIVANITGFRVYDVDVNEQFGFKMRDYSERIKNAKKIYNSSFYDEEATADEKEKAYKNANKAVKVIYEDIIKIYNSAERLGVKPESLYSTMSDFGGVAKYKIEEIQSGKIEDLKRKEEE